MPTPLCVSENIQAWKGLPMEHTPLNTCTKTSSKENSIGSILGSEKGKWTTPRGLFWAQWDTQARPTAAFWKKSSLRSLSISRQESQESESRHFFSFHWFTAPFTVIHSGEWTHPHVAHYFWEVLKQSWCKTGKNKSGEIYARRD